MMDINRDSELQRVLLACFEYWQTEPLPVEKRVICYSWVVGTYKKMFGSEFHPSKLYQLTKLGFLMQDDSARGGNRRYYKIVNPTLVESIANQWRTTLTQ